MKATITFDLNELEDRAKHKLITHIDEITFVLWELDQQMRRVVKYDESKSEEYRKAHADLREYLRELLTEKGLSIEMIS